MPRSSHAIKTIILLFIGFWALPGLTQNLQNYTPSILFGKGDWEAKSFQNLYHQTQRFSESGGTEKVDAGDAQVFFTSINQFLYGVNDQFNVGLDVWVNHTSLPFEGDRETQTGISLIGPKVKIAPFKGLSRLSIQSSYLFAATQDMENREPTSSRPFFFFANDRSLWLTQFFYDLPVNSQFQLFFQQAFWYNVVRDSFRENNFLQTQTSVFASYFPNSKWTIYGMTEYFPTHYNPSEQAGESFFSYFVQSGVGAKYQLIPNKIELELLYTNFWLGSGSEGAGQTFNFGIRLVNQ